MKGVRVVLAGDHKQLPPTIKSRNEGLSVTLFDRVLKEFKAEEVSRLLKIMEWSSKCVYGGQLQAHESVANHQIGNDSILMFIDTAGAKMGESIQDTTNDRKKSKSNQGEADLVKIIFEELKVQGIEEKDVGIITPYNAQVDHIKKLFENNNLNTQIIEVSTVDGFQGREKECIIISMVRSNPIHQVGFLNDYRRMNVAVTRARKFVCLIGDSETVNSDPFLKQMIDYFEEKGEVRSAMEYMGMEDVHFNVGFIDEKAKKDLKQDTSQSSNNKQASSQTKQVKSKDTEKKSKQKQEQKQDTQFRGLEQVLEAPPPQKKQYNEDDLKVEYTRDIQVFLQSKNSELKYEQINSFQRRVLHELAESFSLQHESIGTEVLKDMILRKILMKDEKTVEQDNKQTINQELQDIIYPDQSNTDGKQEGKKNKTKKKKENLDTKKFPQGIVIGSSLAKVESIEESKTSTQPVTEQQTQYLEYVQQKKFEQQRQQEEKERLQALQAEEQRKKQSEKKKIAAAKKKKEQKIPNEEDEMDDLEFLGKLAEAKKYCSYDSDVGKKCGVYVEMLGSNCNYCDLRYCIRHGLQETHGCGERVKKDAREQFEKSFMMQHRGEKHLRKDQIHSLQSILQEKIKQNIDDRKIKQPEKKKQ